MNIKAIFAIGGAAWRGARTGLLALILVMVGLTGFFLVEEGNQLSSWLGLATICAALLGASLVIHLLLWSLEFQPRLNRLILIFAFLLCAGFGLPIWGIPGTLVPAFIIVLLAQRFGALEQSLHGLHMRLGDGLR